MLDAWEKGFSAEGRMNFEINTLLFITFLGAFFAALMAVGLYFLVILAVSLFSTFWEWVWGQNEDGS